MEPHLQPPPRDIPPDYVSAANTSLKTITLPYYEGQIEGSRFISMIAPLFSILGESISQEKHTPFAHESVLILLSLFSKYSHCDRTLKNVDFLFLPEILSSDFMITLSGALSLCLFSKIDPVRVMCLFAPLFMGNNLIWPICLDALKYDKSLETSFINVYHSSLVEILNLTTIAPPGLTAPSGRGSSPFHPNSSNILPFYDFLKAQPTATLFDIISPIMSYLKLCKLTLLYKESTHAALEVENMEYSFLQKVNTVSQQSTTYLSPRNQDDIASAPLQQKPTLASEKSITNDLCAIIVNFCQHIPNQAPAKLSTLPTLTTHLSTITFNTKRTPRELHRFIDNCIVHLTCMILTHLTIPPPTTQTSVHQTRPDLLITCVQQTLKMISIPLFVHPTSVLNRTQQIFYFGDSEFLLSSLFCSRQPLLAVLLAHALGLFETATRMIIANCVTLSSDPTAMNALLTKPVQTLVEYITEQASSTGASTSTSGVGEYSAFLYRCITSSVATAYLLTLQTTTTDALRLPYVAAAIPPQLLGTNQLVQSKGVSHPFSDLRFYLLHLTMMHASNPSLISLKTLLSLLCISTPPIARFDHASERSFVFQPHLQGQYATFGFNFSRPILHIPVIRWAEHSSFTPPDHHFFRSNALPPSPIVQFLKKKLNAKSKHRKEKRKFFHPSLQDSMELAAKERTGGSILPPLAQMRMNNETQLTDLPTADTDTDHSFDSLESVGWVTPTHFLLFGDLAKVRSVSEWGQDRYNHLPLSLKLFVNETMKDAIVSRLIDLEEFVETAFDAFTEDHSLELVLLLEWLIEECQPVVTKHPPQSDPAGRDPDEGVWKKIHQTLFDLLVTTLLQLHVDRMWDETIPFQRMVLFSRPFDDLTMKLSLRADVFVFLRVQLLSLIRQSQLLDTAGCLEFIDVALASHLAQFGDGPIPHSFRFSLEKAVLLRSVNRHQEAFDALALTELGLDGVKCYCLCEALAIEDVCRGRTTEPIDEAIARCQSTIRIGLGEFIKRRQEGQIAQLCMELVRVIPTDLLIDIFPTNMSIRTVFECLKLVFSSYETALQQNSIALSFLHYKELAAESLHCDELSRFTRITKIRRCTKCGQLFVGRPNVSIDVDGNVTHIDCGIETTQEQDETETNEDENRQPEVIRTNKKGIIVGYAQFDQEFMCEWVNHNGLVEDPVPGGRLSSVRVASVDADQLRTRAQEFWKRKYDYHLDASGSDDDRGNKQWAKLFQSTANLSPIASDMNEPYQMADHPRQTQTPPPEDNPDLLDMDWRWSMKQGRQTRDEVWERKNGAYFRQPPPFAEYTPVPERVFVSKVEREWTDDAKEAEQSTYRRFFTLNWNEADEEMDPGLDGRTCASWLERPTLLNSSACWGMNLRDGREYRSEIMSLDRRSQPVQSLRGSTLTHYTVQHTPSLTSSLHYSTNASVSHSSDSGDNASSLAAFALSPSVDPNYHPHFSGGIDRDSEFFSFYTFGGRG
ncbi:hypothetical protein BLNAU_5963 [Blattamonas nauphoetae]|uniref:Uncharacterized protein n=1 Tax=Blattamonas nauphoetae TaxID=2049346 RepID=A0ABQ9Y645_9EUKA|nr:hypothetical protein BLNAU_5963 [Blattamonas nauphoetae]